MLEEMWRKGDTLTLLVGMKIDTATTENSMEGPPKTKNRTTTWSSNSTTVYISGQIESYNSKRFICLGVHSSTVYNSQDMEANWSAHQQMIGLRRCGDTYTHPLLSLKKEWNSSICSNMNGPGDYHTKWSKSDREIHGSCDTAFMQNF